MDPITLATITAAVTVLATEAAKGAASEAGKDLWGKLKTLFGWQTDPKPEELPQTLARRINDDAQLAKQVLDLLQQHPTTTASAMVGHIQAAKVIVANEIRIEGDLKM